MRALWFVVVALLVMDSSLSAQWLKSRRRAFPAPPDGKPDLSASTPRHASGKPVSSAASGAPHRASSANHARPQGGRDPGPALGGNALQGTARQRQPRRSDRQVRRWRRAPFRLRGLPAQILETRAMTVILYEAVHAYRQIFTDGRPLPKDPNPAWSAIRSGAGKGRLRRRIIGLQRQRWLDNAGRPATDR